MRAFVGKEVTKSLLASGVIITGVLMALGTIMVPYTAIISSILIAIAAIYLLCKLGSHIQASIQSDTEINRPASN